MNGNCLFSLFLFIERTPNFCRRGHASLRPQKTSLQASTAIQFNLLIHQEQQYYHSLNHKTKNITIEDSKTPPNWKTVKRPYGYLDQVFSNC